MTHRMMQGVDPPRILLLLTSLVAVSGILLWSSVARADIVGIYSSPSAASCAILQGSITQPTIVHKTTLGATGSRFSAPLPPALGLVWLADLNQFPNTTGDTQNGMTVDYLSCLSGNIHVTTQLLQQIFPKKGCVDEPSCFNLLRIT